MPRRKIVVSLTDQAVSWVVNGPLKEVEAFVQVLQAVVKARAQQELEGHRALDLPTAPGPGPVRRIKSVKVVPPINAGESQVG